MAGPRRMPGLDGLRGLAAVAIVVLHVWMFSDVPNGAWLARADVAVGELRQALMLFFVLSGFLLGGPWVAAALDGRRAPDAGRFLSRRAARVAPGYWLALVGAYLILHGTGSDRAAAVQQLPVFAVFAQNYFAATRTLLDPPMWSLAVEVSFYAVLPLVGWGLVRAVRGRRRGGLLVCGGLVAIGLTWSALGELLAWPPTAMSTLPTYLPIFACGIAAALLAHGREPSPRALRLLLLGGAALVVANAAWHSDGTGLVGHVALDLPGAAGFAAIVAAVGLRPPGVLATAPLRALGTWSFGIYLWHMPVLLWLHTRGLWPGEPAHSLLAVLLPSVLLGALSWRLVERPSLALSRPRPRIPRPAERPPPARVPGMAALLPAIPRVPV